MFGMGLSELAVIAFVAVVVFGPDKLPDLARQAGRFVRSMRGFATSARDELRNELGPEFADLEIRDLDPREIVRKHIIEAMEDEDDRPAKNGRSGKTRSHQDQQVPTKKNKKKKTQNRNAATTTDGQSEATRSNESGPTAASSPPFDADAT
ncbi:MAG: sec-independent translocase [Nocardioides sp.]